jgi:hypothetical protein
MYTTPVNSRAPTTPEPTQPYQIQPQPLHPNNKIITGARKCVIATNIAEASLTIDGIVYVRVLLCTQW